MEFTIKTKVDRLKPISRHVYNFKNANFDKIRAELICVDFSEVCNAIDVNSSWSNFTHIFVSILDRNIPKVKVKDSTSPAWIDSEVRHLQKKKYTAWKRAKKSDSANHWAKFRKLRNRLKNLISRKYDDYIAGFSSTLSDNPKRFWSFYRSLPQFVSHNGMSASTPSKKATLFNNYFFSVFTQPRVRASLPTVSIHHHDLLGTTIFQVDEVLKILKKLDVSKAIGPDGLSPRVLKECCHQIASPLCYIFNISLAEGNSQASGLMQTLSPI